MSAVRRAALAGLPFALALATPAGANPWPWHRDHYGPPYCFPGHHPGPPGVIVNPCCYGYHATQWKKFPEECVPPPVMHAPLAPPAPALLPAPDGKPAKPADKKEEKVGL